MASGKLHVHFITLQFCILQLSIIKTLFMSQKLYNRVLFLAIFTVIYNLAEGLISIYFGVRDETLSLFGFGADSFVETISALGVTQMIYRIKKNPHSQKSDFEKTALQITGWCFYILTLTLSISAIYNLIKGNHPESTLVGMIISLISILSMWLLVHLKTKLGKKLDSQPIIADARCNLVCIYMSIVLLVSSSLWWFFKIPFIDALGALGLAYFSFKEGKESLQKAKGIECCGC